MNVSKELIAKYHQGLCSDQERAQVEAWLNVDSEEELSLSMQVEQKQFIKEELWSAIKGDTIQKNEGTSLDGSTKIRFRTFYWGAAAVLSFGFLCIWLLRYDTTLHNPEISNNGNLPNENMADVNLVVGEGSEANFIDNLERVDFCGAVKVTVNKTMKLVFSTKNASYTKEYQMELLVNAGETCFALGLSENEGGGIIVKSERELNELPPILQNSLRAQFGI